MDPQQTWTDMLEALERKQWEPAKELASRLALRVAKERRLPTNNDRRKGDRQEVARRGCSVHLPRNREQSERHRKTPITTNRAGQLILQRK